MSTIRTGKAVAGCYAGALNDCAGPLEREHYISKNLLDKIGDLFSLSGPSWLSDERVVSEKSLRSKVLCERHNRALSPLDATIGQLYEGLAAYHRGGNIGTMALSGECLERWALKVCAGMLASGTLKLRTGERLEKALLPPKHLQILFGFESMPVGWGLSFFEKGERPLPSSSLAFYPMTRPAGAGRAPEIYGATFVMLGVPFTVAMTRLNSSFGRLWHRPASLRVGTGRIELNWERPGSEPEIVLLTRPHGSTSDPSDDPPPG